MVFLFFIFQIIIDEGQLKVIMHVAMVTAVATGSEANSSLPDVVV